MESTLLTRSIQKRPDRVKLAGRILFLTEDPELIRRQLAGEDLPWDTRNPEKNPKLRDDISTDDLPVVLSAAAARALESLANLTNDTAS